MFSLKHLKRLVFNKKHLFKYNVILRNFSENKSPINSHKLREFLFQNKLKVSPNLLLNYKSLESEFNELKTIRDKELLDLAENESTVLSTQLRQLSDTIICESIDENSGFNECCLDVKCGVGGQEAMLFTKELFTVYTQLCLQQKWNYTVVSDDCDTTHGGSRHSSLIISGNNSFQWLRHEAGVHRVQRFPKTDKHRVHTSTTTVAVIPVRHNLIEIKDKDLSFTMKTSQGAGGQHVNKTLTCVRVTHIPSGVTTECQETRSQIQNKEIAIIKLKAIVNQNEYERKRKEEISTKKAQIGIAARSDKIRTYNYPQNRITDHRLNETVYGIEELFIKGNVNKLLDLMIQLEDESKKQLIDRFRTELNQFCANS